LRTSKLVDLGVTVLRFADDDLLKFPDAVASAIYEAIMSKGPHPNPLPEYRERG
jgi:very-short-patch-repair endonuclease